MKIVMISGKATSGKDTVGDILINKYKYTKFSFATNLKKSVAGAFGWRVEQLEDQAFKATEDGFWGVTPRQVLQVFGSDTMKKFFPKRLSTISKKKHDNLKSIWAQATVKSLMESDYKRIVITDLRFPEELEAVEEFARNYGHTLHSIRVEASYKKMPKNVSENPIIRWFQLLLEWQHISEYMFDWYKTWSLVVYNDSTKERFIERAERMVGSL
jgi:hypothetical protein